jgi:high affinity sulfate transporter 1
MRSDRSMDRSVIPLVRSLVGYRAAWLKQDVIAGILVVALAIPLSMGMAEVAGMPPIAGLYSCVLPLVAYAIVGSSRQLVIALDASTATMLAAAVAPLAASDPGRYAALAAVATILVGLVLIAAGAVRLGFVGDFLSEPILLGYQAGLAVVVTASQVPKLLGVSVDPESTFGLLGGTLVSLAESNLPTLLVGAGSLVVVFALRSWKPAVPGALIAVVAATALVEALDLAARGVAVLGDLPSGLPPVGVPEFTLDDVGRLLGPAAAIALVAAGDTMASSRAFATRNGYRVDANQDLVGLGAANLSSGLSGGITTSASAARTAVVESVGSHTQVASLVAAFVMAVVLVFFTRPLRNVPIAALAAVVIAAVVRLIEPSSLRRLWNVRRPEFVVAILTTLGVVLIGVLEGIVVAVALSILDFVRRAMRPYDAVVGRIDGRRGTFDVARFRQATTDPAVLVYRFDAPLFAANAGRFRSRVQALLDEHPGARCFVVDASVVSDVDATAARMLGELADDLERRGIGLAFVEVLAGVQDLLERYGLGERIRLFDTADDAMLRFHAEEQQQRVLEP